MRARRSPPASSRDRDGFGTMLVLAAVLIVMVCIACR